MRWISYSEAVNQLFDQEREQLRRDPEVLGQVVMEGFTGLNRMTLEGLAAEYERTFGETVRVAFDRSSPGEEDAG